MTVWYVCIPLLLQNISSVQVLYNFMAYFKYRHYVRQHQFVILSHIHLYILHLASYILIYSIPAIYAFVICFRDRI